MPPSLWMTKLVVRDSSVRILASRASSFGNRAQEKKARLSFVIPSEALAVAFPGSTRKDAPFRARLRRSSSGSFEKPARISEGRRARLRKGSFVHVAIVWRNFSGGSRARRGAARTRRMIPDPVTQVTRKLRARGNDECRPRRVARRHSRGTGGAARSFGIGKGAGAAAGHKGRFARCARTEE